MVLLLYKLALLSATATLLSPVYGEEQQPQSLTLPTPSSTSTEPAIHFSLDFGSSNFAAGPREPINLKDKSIPTTGTDGKLLSDNARRFKARMEQMRRKSEQPNPLDAYASACKSSFDFYALKYPADPEYSEPALRKWMDELEGCYDKRPYPGNFSPDEKGYSMIQAQYLWLPVLVRKWIEGDWRRDVDDDTHWGICVVNPDADIEERLAFFPPGVMMGLLPLFAVGNASDGSECGGVFADTRRWGTDTRDGVRVQANLLAKVEVGNELHVKVEAKRFELKREGGKDEL